MKKQIKKNSRFLYITFTPVLLLVILITSWMYTAKESPWIYHEKFPDTYWSTIGNFSFILSIVAFSLVVMRKVFLKTKHIEVIKNSIRFFLIFLSKHHLTIGFTATFLAILHSVYFLFIPIDSIYVFITGVIGTVFMVITLITGYFFYKKRGKNKQRNFHIYTSILFVIFLLLHKFN